MRDGSLLVIKKDVGVCFVMCVGKRKVWVGYVNFLRINLVGRCYLWSIIYWVWWYRMVLMM